MTEFAFLVKGSFDTNPMPPEAAGLFSLQNTMCAHGPSSKAYERAINEVQGPVRVGNDNLGILFETA